jgi:uncharacterized RDD family membrane protein YckC
VYEEDREAARRLSRPPRWRGYQLSSWWRRVGASFVDALIVVPSSTGLFLLLGGDAGEFFDRNDYPIPDAGQLGVSGSAVLIALLYFPAIMKRTNGRTLGKLAVGIRVVRTDEQPMTFTRAALREVAIKYLLVGSAPFVNPVLSFLDGLWPLWDKENRAIHDMLARTRVIRADVERSPAMGEGL